MSKEQNVLELGSVSSLIKVKYCIILKITVAVIFINFASPRKIF